MILRGALTAVYWLAPPGYPTFVSDNESAACDWAQRQLGAGSASPPYAKVG
jgi:hypothetical protein